EHVQRLQQVLDVVRGARAGLVHRLQVARLTLLHLTQLGGVELREQLAQQMQVPLQRRSEAKARIDRQRELRARVLDRVSGALAALALPGAGAPGDAGDRGEALKRRDRLLEETLGA